MSIKLIIKNTEAINNESTIDNLLDTVEKNNQEFLNSENTILLTEHTITKYNKCSDNLGERNEYLSNKIKGVKIIGKVDVYDKSGEILEVKKLSEWAKNIAHEKESYRDLVLEIADSNNNVYDVLHFEKAFIVNYKEIFKGKEDIGEFNTLIRCIDNVDEIIKE